MALGCYQYMLLAFPPFTLLQILPPPLIPGTLLNFTPQNWLLTPNTCCPHQRGPTYTSLWGRCRHGSCWDLLVHYKEPISGVVFISGKLAYEFCSCCLQGQPKPPLTQTLEEHQQSTQQGKPLSPYPGLFPHFLAMLRHPRKHPQPEAEA